jgi:hypothetical protein
VREYKIVLFLMLLQDGNPLYSFWSLTVVVMEALKLVSYGHVNYWQRLKRDGYQKKRPATDDNNKNNKKQDEGDRTENVCLMMTCEERSNGHIS